MKKPLHRFITVLLLLSFSISGLLYVFYDVALFDLKVEAGNNIAAHEHLQTIKIPAREFNNRKDEVWHGGRLYDVSSYTVVNDTVFVTVLHDDREEALVKNIADSFEPNEKCTSDNGVHIVKHRTHTPGDGKVLITPYRMEIVTRNNDACLFLSQSTTIHTEADPAILKPPPRYGQTAIIC